MLSVPGLQVGHVVGVTLVQVVGGVGGGRGLGRGRGAAAQGPLPRAEVRPHGAHHAVERHLGGLPGTAGTLEGALEHGGL